MKTFLKDRWNDFSMWFQYRATSNQQGLIVGAALIVFGGIMALFFKVVVG